MLFILLAHGEVVQRALDKEAVPQLLEDVEDDRVGPLEKTKRQRKEQPRAPKEALLKGDTEVAIPSSAAFKNVREAFEHWLATHGLTLQQHDSGITEQVKGLEGPEIILYEKMRALEGAYNQTPRLLPEALARFESTLAILQHEVPKAKDEIRFQRERSEQYAQSAANVLRVLSQARLEGRLADQDYQAIQEILEVTAKVETTRGLERREAREALLQAAEILARCVRPEVEEWRTISLQERLGQLNASRKAVVEKMGATPDNAKLKPLVRQFETLTEQISRLESLSSPPGKEKYGTRAGINTAVQ